MQHTVRLLAYVNGTLTDMEDISDHQTCMIDITTFPYFCEDHDVYLYDPAEVAEELKDRYPIDQRG